MSVDGVIYISSFTLFGLKNIDIECKNKRPDAKFG